MPWTFSIPADPAHRLLFAASLVTALCVAALLFAVLGNFLLAGGTVRHQRRSPVATATMLLFTAGYYLLIRRHLGALPLPPFPVQLALTIAGLALMVGGCVVNLLGRRALGSNWANQVVIYEAHILVTRGVYRLVRHPLYASIIWMLYGGSLIYYNWAAALAVTLIFVPMMIYRARQEETALAAQFAAYAAYQRRVGRLLPRLTPPQ